MIPFLKVVNDTAVAVNQGGKRKGAVCSYLETWHLDIEEFLDLRKNTGDDRRRTHDMHTANWIPDLFMKRVIADEQWTLFSPNEVPDLHDLYGAHFEERHQRVRAGGSGRDPLHRNCRAVELWRKMLTRCSKPVIPGSHGKIPPTFARLRITSAWCTAGICVRKFCSTPSATRRPSAIWVRSICWLTSPTGELDLPCWKQTVRTAMRMLDNVVDINFYPNRRRKTPT